VAANKVDRLAEPGASARPAGVERGARHRADDGAPAEPDGVAGSIDPQADDDLVATPSEDRAADDPLDALRRMIYPDVVPVSALHKMGLDALLGAIDRAFEDQLVPVTLHIPYTDGQVLHLVHTHGVVDVEVHDETGTRVQARVPPYLMGGIEAYVQ